MPVASFILREAHATDQAFERSSDRRSEDIMSAVKAYQAGSSIKKGKPNVTTRLLGSSAASDSSPRDDDLDVAARNPVIEGNLHVEQIIECPSEILCCRYHQDGTKNILAVGLSDGTIKIYEPESGKMLYSLKDQADMTSKGAYNTVTSLRFKPSSGSDKIEHQHILMATYANGHVKFWHYTSQRCLSTINESRQTLVSSFNPTGTKFTSAGSDSTIHIYDVETKKRLQTCEASDSRAIMNGHRSRIHAVKYHPQQPHLFISGGWDDTVQFWDEREKHSVRMISGPKGPHICGDALDIDEVHNHILTGSWRKNHTLQIWDFATGELIKDVPMERLQSTQLYCANWLGKEMMMCGGSHSNIARIIDSGTLNTIGQLVDLPGAVCCMDSTGSRSDNNPKVACGSRNLIYIIRQDKL